MSAKKVETNIITRMHTQELEGMFAELAKFSAWIQIPEEAVEQQEFTSCEGSSDHEGFKEV